MNGTSSVRRLPSGLRDGRAIGSIVPVTRLTRFENNTSSCTGVIGKPEASCHVPESRTRRESWNTAAVLSA